MKLLRVKLKSGLALLNQDNLTDKDYHLTFHNTNISVQKRSEATVRYVPLDNCIFWESYPSNDNNLISHSAQVVPIIEATEKPFAFPDKIPPVSTEGSISVSLGKKRAKR